MILTPLVFPDLVIETSFSSFKVLISIQMGRYLVHLHFVNFQTFEFKWSEHRQVQFYTDLFKARSKYLCTKGMNWGLGKLKSWGLIMKCRSKWDKSAHGICHQVAAWVPEMFWGFINWKMTVLLITQKPLKLEKNKHRFAILRIIEIFWCRLG